MTRLDDDDERHGDRPAGRAAASGRSAPARTRTRAQSAARRQPAAPRRSAGFSHAAISASSNGSCRAKPAENDASGRRRRGRAPPWRRVPARRHSTKTTAPKTDREQASPRHASRSCRAAATADRRCRCRAPRRADRGRAPPARTRASGAIASVRVVVIVAVIR